MTEKTAVQDVYPDDYSWCYGCGKLNDKGHQLKTRWHGNKTETIYKPQPEHTAVPGFVYGGLIASLIDCHGTGSASLALHRKNGHEPGDGHEPPRFVTASLKVDFMKPTPHGIPLKAVGTLEEVHPKKWKVHTEVFAGDTLCVKGEVMAVVMPDSFLKQTKTTNPS
ncbi:Acyl-coenzyme A thioesterase PaaI, contains HGG motif [Fictibacillus solisalsi]|uniref:Acyl-coenzyme A thioesterase PaaI, contains HGG motif n=1 Tax=Fictibacillus solisalsi TaxID=459525 RepID=A0A1H0A2Q0_9BACL|nr:PaaI family thioesterase [Fictibacillus solisalsi]SDN27243.1 Acyl-coenzyme A thioesterase PaaI, contains HGG motif [Fictibacillus solisalsi]